MAPMTNPAARTSADINAVIGSFLRDLAFAQSSQHKMFGYKRAAAAILSLDVPLIELIDSSGVLPRIAGIGPGSTRIIREILATGESATVEHAIDRRERPACRYRTASTPPVPFSQPCRSPPDSRRSLDAGSHTAAVPR